MLEQPSCLPLCVFVNLSVAVADKSCSCHVVITAESLSLVALLELSALKIFSSDCPAVRQGRHPRCRLGAFRDGVRANRHGHAFCSPGMLQHPVSCVPGLLVRTGPGDMAATQKCYSMLGGDVLELWLGERIGCIAAHGLKAAQQDPACKHSEPRSSCNCQVHDSTHCMILDPSIAAYCRCCSGRPCLFHHGLHVVPLLRRPTWTTPSATAWPLL